MSDNRYPTKSFKGTWRTEYKSYTHDLPVSPSGSLELMIETTHETDHHLTRTPRRRVSVQVEGLKPETLFDAWFEVIDRALVFFIDFPVKKPPYKLCNFLEEKVMEKMYDPFSSSEFHIQP